MIEFLRSIWSPVAAVGGVVLGVVVSHIWTRIRGRVATLRWVYSVHRVAASAEDARFGVVEIQWNGNAVQNLFMVHVDLSNDSHADLDEFELQIGFRDGSVVLGEAAEVRGSLSTLAYSGTYQTAPDRLLASGEGDDVTTLQTDVYQNRFFSVPSLTRGDVVGMSFLVHAEPGVTPRPLLYCEAKGVRLREHPPKAQLLGVPQDAAGLSGTALGIGAILAVGFWVDYPIGLVMAAFVIGAFAQILGVGAIHLKRLLGRIMG